VRLLDYFQNQVMGKHRAGSRPATIGCDQSTDCASAQRGWYDSSMTKLLEQGIMAVQELPAERQDMAGELLLKLAANELQYGLTRQQIEDLKLAIEEADRGEFATDKEMTETWKSFGL
jgi:hypothetical protein